MIEEVSVTVRASLVHYLPHKGILDLLEKTPLRIVFDAAFHAQGQLSSNDVMYKGTNFWPKFQRSSLIWVSEYKIVKICDSPKNYVNSWRVRILQFGGPDNGLPSAILKCHRPDWAFDREFSKMGWNASCPVRARLASMVFFRKTAEYLGGLELAVGGVKPVIDEVFTLAEHYTEVLSVVRPLMHHPLVLVEVSTQTDWNKNMRWSKIEIPFEINKSNR